MEILEKSLLLVVRAILMIVGRVALVLLPIALLLSPLLLVPYAPWLPPALFWGTVAATLVMAALLVVVILRDRGRQ